MILYLSSFRVEDNRTVLLFKQRNIRWKGTIPNTTPPPHSPPLLPTPRTLTTLSSTLVPRSPTPSTPPAPPSRHPSSPPTASATSSTPPLTQFPTAGPRELGPAQKDARRVSAEWAAGTGLSGRVLRLSSMPAPGLGAPQLISILFRVFLTPPPFRISSSSDINISLTVSHPAASLPFAHPPSSPAPQTYSNRTPHNSQPR